MANPVINKKVLFFSGNSFCPEANALFLRMAAAGAPPSTARKILINATILSLISSGTWALLDCLWVTASHAAGAANLNWKVNSSNLTPVASPTFAVDRGYTGNASTSYLQTGFNPAVNGVNYTLDNAAHGLYCRTNNNTAGTDMGVGIVLDTSILTIRFSDNNSYGRVNSLSSGNVIAASADSRGFFTVRRTASNVIAINKNGAQVASDIDASSALPAGQFYICGNNGNNVLAFPCDRQIALGYTGSASINDATFYTIIQSYMTAIGANV